MDAFSYLSVLLSIIIGLAVTQLLAGVRGVLLHRDRVRLYAPPLVWVGILLAIATQTWWASFGLRSRAAWSFADFAVVLLQTIVLYLLAGLVLPDVGERPVDLRAHYYAHHRLFFGLSIVAGLVSLAKDVVLSGHLPESRNVAFHVAFMTLGAVVAVTRRPRVHETLVVVAAALFALYITLLFAKLD